MYLEEYGTTIKRKGIKKGVKDFYTFLYNGMFYEYWLSPLYNFASESESNLKLSSDLYIRKITSTEFSHIFQLRRGVIPTDWWVRFVLIKKIQHDDHPDGHLRV